MFQFIFTKNCAFCESIGEEEICGITEATYENVV
jgi:hypothetical protein